MKRLAPAGLILIATPAVAHHPLAGRPMQSFADGLLSGIGHPILGFDHLFFVLAAGLAARLAGAPLRAPLAYIAAMLIGCAALYAGVAMPLREPAIAVSLIVIGAVLASGRATAPAALIGLFAGFGLFHGAAFGTSIAAQEGGVSGPVLAGYLLGLSVLQYALAIAAGAIGGRFAGTARNRAVPARLAGAMVAGAGLLLGLEALEGPVLAWLVS